MREGRWWGGEGEKTIMAEIPVRRPLGTGSTNEDTHGRRWFRVTGCTGEETDSDCPRTRSSIMEWRWREGSAHFPRWPDSLARRATHGGVTKQGRGGGEEGGEGSQRRRWLGEDGR